MKIREGLQRYIESYSVSGSNCEKIPVTKELQEKYHITEAVNKLQESGKLEEAGSAGQTLYRFPISRFNHLNHNRRMYPRSLWENVIRDQEHEWKGRVGLADHPPEDSDGEFKNAAIIWHDMDIDDQDDLIWGTGSFVGPYGRLAQEIVDAGGRVGFSSSGFGELEMDGSTVNPETYQLERCADVVLNPSQDVFGDSSNSLNIEYSRQGVHNDGMTASEEMAVVENTEKDKGNTNLTESNGESLEANLNKKENRMDRNDNARPVSKLEEKKFRRDIQTFLEDASRMDNPQARLTELEEIVTYFEEGVAPDLREQVEAKILEEKENLESMLNEAQKTNQTFGVKSSDELKMGVALLAEEVKVAEAEAKDWEKIALVLKENNAKLREALKEAHGKMNTLPNPKFVEELKARIDVLEAQRRKITTSYQEEAEDKQKSLSEADSLIENQHNVIEELNRQLEGAHKEIQTLKDEGMSQKEAEAEVAKQRKASDEELEEARGTIEDQAEAIKILEGRADRLQKALEEAKAEKQELQENFENYKQDLAEADTPRFIPKAEDRIGSHLNFKEAGGAAVEAYWADLVQRHGEAISPYERQIRGCKTYREASAAYIRVLPQIDEDNMAAIAARLPESTSISKAERQAMLENQGMSFGQEKTVVDRMPKGWQ